MYKYEIDIAFKIFIKTEDNTCECDVAGKRLSHLQNFTG